MSETPNEEIQAELRESPSTVTGLVWAARSLTEIAKKRAFEGIGGNTQFEHLTDKEVRTSLEATTINICNRLDKILTDEKLWNFGKPDVETEARKREQARLNSHPMLAYNVRITATSEGVTVAIPGSIKANGRNLEAALDALQEVLFPETKNPT